MSSSAPDGKYAERGETRSGRRFAQRNFGHYPSLRHLEAAHPRLLQLEAPLSQRGFRIGVNRGTLVQATLRFSTRHPNIRAGLLDHFAQLFQEHVEDTESGFEVVVTFNAALSNAQSNSFSVFYGHDFRANNVAGAAPELSHSTYFVRTLGDVGRLPVEFNFEELAEAHRHAFEQSGVHIAKFLSVVYLVYRYVPPVRRSRLALTANRRRRLDQPPRP